MRVTQGHCDTDTRQAVTGNEGSGRSAERAFPVHETHCAVA